jgi:hypothetical protein
MRAGVPSSETTLGGNRFLQISKIRVLECSMGHLQKFRGALTLSFGSKPNRRISVQKILVIIIRTYILDFEGVEGTLCNEDVPSTLYKLKGRNRQSEVKTLLQRKVLFTVFLFRSGCGIFFVTRNFNGLTQFYILSLWMGQTEKGARINRLSLDIHI